MAPGHEVGRYCAVIAAGMVAVLSASSTKRGIYLMPVLPLLFMAFAVNLANWRISMHGATTLGRGWQAQAIGLGAYVLAPPIAAIVYLRQPDPVALLFLGLAALACAALYQARRNASRGIVALCACALLTTATLLVLLPRVLNDTKDMAPFVTWIDSQLPPGAALHVVGADETLLGIVPFVTGRQLINLGSAADFEARSPDGEKPGFLLIQSKNQRADPVGVSDNYSLAGSVQFGPKRKFALWRKTAPPGAQ